jgi:hypothetical protein
MEPGPPLFDPSAVHLGFLIKKKGLLKQYPSVLSIYILTVFIFVFVLYTFNPLSIIIIIFLLYYLSTMGRDSSVGIATCYGLDGPVIEYRWGRDFPRPLIQAVGSTQPPIQWVPVFSEGKAAGAWL